MIQVPNVKLSVGDQQIGELQTYHMAGPVEGPWWTRYSWWVIPLGSFWLIGATLAALFFAALTTWLLLDRPTRALDTKVPASAAFNPPASSTQTETAAVIANFAKDVAAITSVLAEQKATAQASASATASASTVTTKAVAPPPPRVERRVPAAKQAEPACQCPPEPAKTPAVDKTQSPAQAPALSSAERRRNEMWSALRR